MANNGVMNNKARHPYGLYDIKIIVKTYSGPPQISISAYYDGLWMNGNIQEVGYKPAIRLMLELFCAICQSFFLPIKRRIYWIIYWPRRPWQRARWKSAEKSKRFYRNKGALVSFSVGKWIKVRAIKFKSGDQFFAAYLESGLIAKAGSEEGAIRELESQLCDYWLAQLKSNARDGQPYRDVNVDIGRAPLWVYARWYWYSACDFIGTLAEFVRFIRSEKW